MSCLTPLMDSGFEHGEKSSSCEQRLVAPPKGAVGWVPSEAHQLGPLNPPPPFQSVPESSSLAAGGFRGPEKVPQGPMSAEPYECAAKRLVSEWGRALHGTAVTGFAVERGPRAWTATDAQRHTP